MSITSLSEPTCHSNSSPKSEADINGYSEPFDNIHRRPEGSFTTLPCRIHKDDAQVVETAKSFSAEVISALSHNSAGLPCEANSCVGHFASLVYPECLPERLDDIVRIVEGGVFHDDILEKDELNRVTAHNDMVTSVLQMPQATSVLEPSLGVKHFVSEVVSTFVSKQGVEGQVLMSKCLKGWFEPLALAPETEPTSFEESVSRRILDVGTIALRGILEFSLGIILSEEDTEHLQELVYIADRIVANTNDYFSWEVERDGSGRLQNSVKVLMITEGKSEQEAKERLKATILADEQKFQELLERFYVTFPGSPDHMKKFVKGLQLYLGGHHIWCSACDRYKIKTTAIDNGANYISTDSVKDQLYSQDSMPTKLGDSALLAPVEYILSLPSKNMRSRVIDALNLWFQLPDDQLANIKCVVDDLHNSTLMLDDIQDSSDLRRGCAATHQVFGIAQTTNSATYMVARAASTVVTYQDQYPQLINIFLDGTKALALGQSWDLDWRFTGYCPSIAEYMAMVDGKTGAMFEMIIRMMHCFSCTENLPIADLSRLTRLLGRWYQIRDDYQNIQDEHYTAQKGFCEDFDEGKLSYPVTVCCNLDPRAGAIVMGILRQRGNHGTSLPTSVKRQVLDKIRQTGALQQTWEALQNLERDTEAVLVTIESITGKPNPSFRTFVKLLSNVSRP